MIQVGDFTLSECPHGGIWIQRSSGEGMQVIAPETVAALEKLLEAFWQEQF